MSDERNWQDRAIEATGGHRTEFGALLLAILQKSPRRVPAFADNAIIDEHGIVITNKKDKNGVMHNLVRLKHIAAISDDFKLMADKLMFTDAERLELVDKIHKWIVTDLRAVGKANLK